MTRISNGVLGSLVLGAWVLLFPAGGSALARETVVYSFCSKTNCADGAYPSAALIEVDGTLYGTTHGGGVTGCGGGGCGTVFALDPRTGAETVLYALLR